MPGGEGIGIPWCLHGGLPPMGRREAGQDPRAAALTASAAGSLMIPKREGLWLELEVSDGIDTLGGDFDVVRWRIGVGYAYPFSPTASVYGRLSFDNAEFKDVRVAGFNLDADADGDGIGGEVGMIWAAMPAFHLQGHVRYTSVGEVAGEGSDPFDSDTLIGLNARWYFRPGIALISGCEFGKITTWNVGVRFTF
jgi:hypothetical protein